MRQADVIFASLSSFSSFTGSQSGSIGASLVLDFFELFSSVFSFLFFPRMSFSLFASQVEQIHNCPFDNIHSSESYCKESDVIVVGVGEDMIADVVNFCEVLIIVHALLCYFFLQEIVVWCCRHHFDTFVGVAVFQWSSKNTKSKRFLHFTTGSS